MDITVITDSDSLYCTFEELIAWATTLDVCVAWATSSNGQGRHWEALDLAKIRRAVVGTAFAQTEPAALVAFNQKADCLRLMINTTGTFHPKVVLAQKGRLRRAIVGSANLTTAAFTHNTELSMLLEGHSSDPTFKKLESFIKKHWSEGVALDNDWLAKYTLAWKEAKRRRVIVPGAPLEGTSLTDLDMTWDQYAETIVGQEGRMTNTGFRISVSGPAPSYLEELRRAREAFRGQPRFAKMSKDQLDLMMGYGKLSGGLLGSMKVARDAKIIVRDTPERIGAVLDRLPFDGAVSLALATDLLGELMQISGIKLAVATRFFALKRPDLFVSMNRGSREELAKLHGGRPVTTLEHYVKLLIALWETEWHRAPRPSNSEHAALWDCRVALLDSAVYGAR
ncbi:TPA: phospholipase D-like domain-containing protein [Stenotrophomonas maltophilia]